MGFYSTLRLKYKVKKNVSVKDIETQLLTKYADFEPSINEYKFTFTVKGSTINFFIELLKYIKHHDCFEEYKISCGEEYRSLRYTENMTTGHFEFSIYDMTSNSTCIVTEKGMSTIQEPDQDQSEPQEPTKQEPEIAKMYIQINVIDLICVLCR